VRRNNRDFRGSSIAANEARANAANSMEGGGIQILSFKEADGVEFVHSYNHGNGQPEYFAANVPSGKTIAVVQTINHIATIENVAHRHSIRGYGNLLFWFNLVEGEAKERLLQEKCRLMNQFISQGAPPIIYELRPLFECSVTDHWWGGRPPAPDGQERIVDEILVAWEEQRDFTLEVLCKGTEMGEDYEWAMRTLFHDQVDEIGLENVLIPRHKRVDLTLALKHIDDWKVDWDKSLNEEQILFVKEHPKYFQQYARVMFRAKPICDHCGAVDDLKKCRGCKSTQYCSRECQLADWRSHKELCKQYKAMRNRKLVELPSTNLRDRALSQHDSSNQEEESSSS